MVQPINFDILFDNASLVYHSGSLITGHVVLELPEFIKFRGIHMKFKGKAKVEWEEESKDSEDESSRKYKAKEKYLEKDLLIYGNPPGSSAPKLELPMGRHTFPFQFQLPQGLPSSFDDTLGSIHYKAKCKVIRLSDEDFKTSRSFNITGVLDLNSKPEYGSPLSGSDQKFLCCCCCRSGPIIANFSIERMGWVPGESIQINAEIINHASRAIDKSYVTLTRKTVFKAEGDHQRLSKKEEARVCRPAIPAYGRDTWETEVLNIPSLAPSNFAGCNIIENTYILTLYVDPGDFALDLEIPLTIIIGTIPLGSSVVYQQPIPHMATSYPMPMSGPYGQPMPVAGPYGEPMPPVMTMQPMACWSNQPGEAPPSYDQLSQLENFPQQVPLKSDYSTYSPGDQEKVQL